MPLYDFECDYCGNTEEVFLRMDAEKVSYCSMCHELMRQIPSVGLVKGEEAAWLNSVREVVDKEGGPHCQEFLKDPTRSNYQRWMKGEGLRPLEPGEEQRKRPSRADREKRIQEKAISLSCNLQKSRNLGKIFTK